jgi:hypothetical protein
MENPLWGAPRIHGELLELGFDVAQSSVAKYMVKSSNKNRPHPLNLLHAIYDHNVGPVAGSATLVSEAHDTDRDESDQKRTFA